MGGLSISFFYLVVGLFFGSASYENFIALMSVWLAACLLLCDFRDETWVGQSNDGLLRDTV